MELILLVLPGLLSYTIAFHRDQKSPEDNNWKVEMRRVLICIYLNLIGLYLIRVFLNAPSVFVNGSIHPVLVSMRGIGLSVIHAILLGLVMRFLVSSVSIKLIKIQKKD